MKIKGWKKVADTPLYKRWIHEYKSGDTLTVTVLWDNLVWIERNEAGNWALSTTLLKRMFPTQKKAVDFAINWMRKHPNG